MKVITYSRFYPAYHPKAGLPTYFVEKILASIGHPNYDEERQFNPRLSLDEFDPKHHTIRAGHRWKEGEWFSPRVWSGKPYASKQIAFAPPIQIVRIYYFMDQVEIGVDTVGIIARNDGLSFVDFMQWFKYPSEFSGQILIWDKYISY